MGDMSRRALLLSVWDKDLGKANDYLGDKEIYFCSLLARNKNTSATNLAPSVVASEDY
jgi:hypothetical protein